VGASKGGRMQIGYDVDVRDSSGRKLPAYITAAPPVRRDRRARFHAAGCVDLRFRLSEWPMADRFPDLPAEVIAATDRAMRAEIERAFAGAFGERTR